MTDLSKPIRMKNYLHYECKYLAMSPFSPTVVAVAYQLPGGHDSFVAGVALTSLENIPEPPVKAKGYLSLYQDKNTKKLLQIGGLHGTKEIAYLSKYPSSIGYIEINQDVIPWGS